MCTARCCSLLMMLASTLHADWSSAQNYPTKPIRILTSGAGANPDFVSRILAKDLSASLGQTVIVENRAQGPVLGATLAQSAPDGHTLMVAGDSLWVGQLFNAVTYDANRDFAPIGRLTVAPAIFSVHPSLPVKTVDELIKLARAKPGELNYSTGTAGGAGHIALEHIKYLTKTNIVPVFYKDQATQNADTISGRVHMTFGNAATWVGLIKAGSLRAIATGGATRSAIFPDLPTVSETIPGIVSEGSLALFAPAKTPEAIINRLNQEATRIIEKPDVRQQLLPTTQEPATGTPRQLGDMVRDQLEKVGKLMKEIGLNPK